MISCERDTTPRPPPPRAIGTAADARAADKHYGDACRAVPQPMVSAGARRCSDPPTTTTTRRRPWKTRRAHTRGGGAIAAGVPADLHKVTVDDT